MIMTSTPTPDAYLLDTSVASIAWDGGNKDHALIRGRLSALGESTVAVCAISIGEVAYGLDITDGADPSRHQAVRDAMETYYVWPVDKDTSQYYSVLRGELFRRYAPRDKRGRIKAKRPEELLDTTSARELGIQENDLWIVSVAVQYDLRLVTRDDRLKRILEIAQLKYGYDRYEIWPVSASRPTGAS
jgi:tRNA(fMet)-specific endonuclease VapC